MDNRQRTVAILIFDDVEVLDFCGPFEVFSVTRVPDNGGERAPFKVVTVAENADVVSCRGGLLVQPHATIDDEVRADILVVPGGFGTRRVVGTKRVLNWVTERNKGTELTTSVCTGAFVLAEAGLLDGLRATTHWMAIERLRQNCPGTIVLDNSRVVDEGHIITSAGISAGIDMSLHVVARLLGDEIARQTAREMEYDWRGAVPAPSGTA
jgi:transcriptional regulator GlxA family with amidase domain